MMKTFKLLLLLIATSAAFTVYAGANANCKTDCKVVPNGSECQDLLDWPVPGTDVPSNDPVCKRIISESRDTIVLGDDYWCCATGDGICGKPACWQTGTKCQSSGIKTYSYCRTVDGSSIDATQAISTQYGTAAVISQAGNIDDYGRVYFKVIKLDGTVLTAIVDAKDLGGGVMDAFFDSKIMVEPGDKIGYMITEIQPRKNPVELNYVGWRIPTKDPVTGAYTDSQITEMIAYAHTKGIPDPRILHYALWADGVTGSYYDSYDFNDAGGLLVVYESCPAAPVCDTLPVTLTYDPVPYRLASGNVDFTATSGANPVYQYKALKTDTFKAGALNFFDTAVTYIDKPNGLIVQGSRNTELPAEISNWTWTHNYTIASIACPSQNKQCSKQLPFDVLPPMGYYVTEGGGYHYLQGGLNMTNYPGSAQKKISVFTFGSGSGSVTPSSASLLSFHKFLLLNYLDEGGKNPPSGWYSKLKGRLDKDGRFVKVDLGSTDWNTLSSKIADPDKVAYVRVSGDLNIAGGLKCDKKAIIAISGNLIIEPDFGVNKLAGVKRGCVFVVQGKTEIRGGTNKALTYPRVPQDDSQSDIVEGFFITNAISIPQDGLNPLYVKGGVISFGGTAPYLQRNVNSLTKFRPAFYSEDFYYEGARYIDIFGQYLSEPIRFSIREVQYTGGL
jgi:hypothetical protein